MYRRDGFGLRIRMGIRRMSKRVLMAATVPSMIGQFNMNNIELLQEMGYQVDVACDFTDHSVWPEDRVESFREQLADMGVDCFQLDFSRNPLKFARHAASYRETLRLLRTRDYEFIHTHTPIASAIIRMAAHRTGCRVIYTAHGFHFYSGAPLKNWLIFYPVEKILSRLTDVLVVITQEDYRRAQKHFHAGDVVYVPGVGVDTGKFQYSEEGRRRIRAELGLDDSQILLLSVGELNENKNHSAVIRALRGLPVVYAVVGKGDLSGELKRLADEKGVNLILTGFRRDVADFYSAADAYILPSIREGLNVSLMEAMSCGLAVACGRIRGNTDLIEEPLFDPRDVREIRRAVIAAVRDRKRLGRRNRQRSQSVDIRCVRERMREVYQSVSRG